MSQLKSGVSTENGVQISSSVIVGSRKTEGGGGFRSLFGGRKKEGLPEEVKNILHIFDDIQGEHAGTKDIEIWEAYENMEKVRRERERERERESV